jgi:DNA-directed RNA polymerase subunit RPC12/RpoP
MILKIKNFEELKKQLYNLGIGNKDNYQIHSIAENIWQHEFDNEKEEKEYFDNREFAEFDTSDISESKEDRCNYCGGIIYPARKGEKQDKLVKYDDSHYVCKGCFRSVNKLEFNTDYE